MIENATVCYWLVLIFFDMNTIMKGGNFVLEILLLYISYIKLNLVITDVIDYMAYSFKMAAINIYGGKGI